MTASLRRRLTAAWTGRGPLARALLPLALLYGLLVRARALAYRLGLRRTVRLPVPVVVVGNVVAGGSGKTPVVVAVVEHLQSAGWRPGVVARGYGRSGTGVAGVDASSTPDAVGDEPLMVWRRTGAPTWVGSRRVAAAQALLAAHPEVDILVSDDGLQHLALARDLEVVVSGADGIGNGWMLPAGPLREPWPRRCDLLLDAGHLDGGPRHAVRRRLAGDTLSRDGRRQSLEVLARPGVAAPRPIWALAAIAHPQRFFDMLREHGLVLDSTLALADHAPIDAQTLAPCAGALLLCTEKDADKVWRLRPDALAVPLRLEIAAEAWSTLDRLLAARRTRRLS